MKKAMLLAVCLILAGLLAVNGTFALPDISEIFAPLTDLLGEFGSPVANTDEFDVSLVYPDGSQAPQLTPGGTVSRQIAVANGQNSSAAYFRLAFAVRENVLTYLELSTSGDGYTWLDEWRDITIGNNSYKLMIATYTKELPTGETSDSAMLSVSMDTSITSEQLALFDEDFLQIQVLAIDSAAFEDAEKEMILDQGQTMAEAILDLALPVDSLDFNPF